MSRIIVLITFAVALALSPACNSEKKTKKKSHSDQKAGGAKVTPNPDKKGPHIAIEVYAKGYKPDKIDAKPGDAVLVFTRTSEKGCGDFIKIDGLKGKTKLPLNKPVEIGVHFPKSGKVRFACGMDMLTGVVTIQ